MTTIDIHESNEKWIAEVHSCLLPKLHADQRFIDVEKLTKKFKLEIETWRKRGKFGAVVEIGNELAAADCLLDSMGEGDKLMYERSMAGTEKRIDFLAITSTGQRNWIEVKTVAPQWVDGEEKWQRFTRIAQGFPENAQLDVKKEWMGAAVGGQFINTRWSFIKCAAEIEARAAFIPDSKKGPVSLLFCSTGSAWCVDELEDFAYCYRTGKPRADDLMQNAAKKYMHDEGISFNRSLAGFHYLGRECEEVFAYDFRMNLSGPSRFLSR